MDLEKINKNSKTDEDINNKIDGEIISNEFHMQLILKCLEENDRKGLIELAMKNGGYMSDRLRRDIWPQVAKLSVIETSPRPDAQTIENHAFYNQVLLDVNRSLKRFPPSIRETQRISMQDALVRLIMRVLIKNPQLFYYQGYHDICVTFLLVMGEEMAFYIVNKLSKTHLRVFMEETMEKTGDLLEIILIIVRLESKEISDHLDKSSVGTMFSLSWVITWFSHVLKKYDEVVRLFDLFIVSHELMPLYLTVAIILSKQTEILATDCDMASMHHYLTNIPENNELDFDSLISSALLLISKHNPEDMKKMQEKEKKHRINMEKKRLGVIKRYFSFLHLFNYMTRFNFFSLTVVIVFFATIYQYFWNS